MILVRGDRHELGLGEDEGLEVLGGAGVLAPGVDVDHVEARLVAVHRVEDDVPVLVQLVVGQLELVEGDHLLHPLRTLDKQGCISSRIVKKLLHPLGKIGLLYDKA